MKQRRHPQFLPIASVRLAVTQPDRKLHYILQQAAASLGIGAAITVASWRMLPASEPTLAASATTVIAAPILGWRSVLLFGSWPAISCLTISVCTSINATAAHREEQSAKRLHDTNPNVIVAIRTQGGIHVARVNRGGVSRPDQPHRRGG